MQLTPDQMQDADDYALAVRNASTRALAQLDPPASLDLGTVITAAIDGQIAAAAMYAEAAGIAPTKRDKRRLADECRAALLEAIENARAELDDAAAFAPTAH